MIKPAADSVLDPKTHKLRRAATFALAFCMLLAAGTAPAQQPPLETAIVDYQSVPSERVLDGVIEAVNHSTISAQVSARVTAIHFDVDDHVEQGTLVLEFDDTEYRARLREARARRNAASATVDAARAHFDRISNLYERRTASQAEYDQARADLDAATASLAAAEAGIEQIEQLLEYTRVTAPYSGIVTERHIELGETANPGTPLMSGFSLEQLRVVVDFPQRLLAAFEQYKQARLLLPGTAAGSVDALEITVFPYAVTSSSTIPVRLLLPRNLGGVYPGMLVKAAFTMGTRLRMSIPESALVYRSEVVGTYVVDSDGQVSFRHLRTGNSAADGTVEILSGLEVGEAVALQPALAADRLKSRNPAN